jgi:lysylphosphatidylglycerol synthetase-like protein (DUF2156 family)
VLVPKFSKLLVITNHRILTAATLIFAVEVLYTNLSTVFPYRVLPMVASLSFAALLFSLGYLYKTEGIEERRRALAAVAGISPVGLKAKPA